MSRGFDPRVTPARPDLAAADLRGKVDAPRYAQGRAMRVVEASAPLRRAPRADAPLETEALFGETITVYDESEGWAWAQLTRDAYVGYLPSAALKPPGAPATHRVAVPRAHLYPGPSIKLPPRMALSLGALVAVRAWDGDFGIIADGSQIWARHLADAASDERDFVAVAELYLNAPYLWGGRTSEGIDCSGLVQGALTAAGIASPSRQRHDGDRAWRACFARGPLARGDLVFWKGHVGVMRDPETLLHASGWHMQVVSESLADARAASPQAPAAGLQA